MTIATWNLERPQKTSKRLPAIIDCIKKINPDILVLTETTEFIDLGEGYHFFHSAKLPIPYYKEGERRVSIYSKYRPVKALPTFRNDTSICVRFATPLGNLDVLGTVIGIYGNREKSFNEDLELQLTDFFNIGYPSPAGACIAGDFNISFSDNYYYTKEGRNKLKTLFKSLNLDILTEKIPDNIDHIVVSKYFRGKRRFRVKTWNTDKSLSDHIGVAIVIEC
jgi:endonuclease/exonuclease/phosphatase family metal-dependent hydrolase